MPRPKNKVKFALWLHPETLEKADKLYRLNNSQSRSEFIEDAINFYSGYLSSEESWDFFPSVIVTTVKGILDGYENRMASLLFKLAVEIAMTLHVTAATNEIDQEELSRLRGMCVNEVKKLNGKVSFDDAVKKQKG